MNIDVKANKPIYLDNQSTTPVDPRVLEVMFPYFSQKFGNPHSNSHFYGWEVAEAVDIAREQVAAMIGAEKEEIFFTSGATESNNIAIKGVARYYKNHRNHVITCVTEHMCVLDSAFQLEKEGFDVTYLRVDKAGLLDLDELKRSITNKTILVSVMAVQNEIGIIQPLSEIGAICAEQKVFFHTDAAQAIGKIPMNVREMNVNLLSLTAHKVYGPMGVGAIFVSKSPQVKLDPIFNGGGQENGLRSGTLSPALCVGFGRALELAMIEMNSEAAQLIEWRDYFWNHLRRELSGLHLNGSQTHRVAGNLNISVEGVNADSLMSILSDLAFSSGSACTSESEESSHVLKSIGLSNELAEASFRVGLGRFNTKKDVEFSAGRFVEAIREIRSNRSQTVAAE
ncbi:MAG: aminotransferase class V-fold PLP-dependent enzyme [Pseudomonadota bacterium]|nr:aminotransferase class V-fold PLP-dependent enzyme [Pseudomonadota bacterium]